MSDNFLLLFELLLRVYLLCQLRNSHELDVAGHKADSFQARGQIFVCPISQGDVLHPARENQ